MRRSPGSDRRAQSGVGRAALAIRLRRVPGQTCFGLSASSGRGFSRQGKTGGDLEVSGPAEDLPTYQESVLFRIDGVGLDLDRRLLRQSEYPLQALAGLQRREREKVIG